MLRRILSAVAALIFLLDSAPARRPETGFLDRTLSYRGQSYRYQVFLPRIWDKHKKWPVILFLHGLGERGDDGLLETDVGLGHAIREHVASFPLVVVMPQCRKNKLWTEADMESQALAALDRSLAEFNGDRERVYLTGISMGGYGAWDLAAKYPERFAAYVVICGGILPPDATSPLRVSLAQDAAVRDPYAETARRIGKTAVWIFHGSADSLVPVGESRKMYAALKAEHGNVKYTEFAGVGHFSWNRAYADPGLVPWLLEHQLQH
jgi:predicted peptidase